MLRHLILLLFTFGLILGGVGCTSGDKEGDSGDAEAEMADIGEEGDEDSEGEGAEGDDPFAEGGDEEDPFDSDFEEGDEGGEETADLGEDDLAPAEEGGDDFGDDFGEGDDLALDEGGDDPFAEGGDINEEMGDAGAGDDLAAADDGTSDAPADDFTEPMESSGGDDFSDTMAGGDSGDLMDDPSDSMDEPERTWVPVKKIADTPFNKNGVLINAVYLARDGDTLENISQKIYGSDRTEDLLNANPSYRNSTLDVGEKVYYNSPTRPNDDAMLKTYYEDMGLAPETYIAQEGDNIRKVSMDLLGNEASWKEVWATNPSVESKGDLDSGTQLQYWGSADVAGAPPVAANDTPPRAAS